MHEFRPGLVLLLLTTLAAPAVAQDVASSADRKVTWSSPEAQPSRTHPVRPDAVGSWLRYKGVQVTTTEPGGSTTEFLRISPWIADADIVGLGDGTHGTHEYYTVKQRLIEYLAGADGFRTVAFEGPWSDFNAINDYIQGGEGNVRTLLDLEGSCLRVSFR